ncbi:MAG: Asp-tRNA(Asn)/Glu-tRNA(Gln) amidotransferase subunit GatA [Patescibacteria group bacterium]|nr:Asp-tRNA(Asn)/Glu-tRNA(Gln) amidotransferase subunit GatA [Patescibacteria group bacterium]
MYNTLTITQAIKELESGNLTSRKLTEACLTQIQSLDGALHAFLEVYADEALEQADRSDIRRAEGNVLGPLDGIPIALKDNIMVQNKRCTAGSKMLATYNAAYDATVTKKLTDAGAVIIGKTNLDEFAMGGSTEQSAFGPTKNPHDPDRVPGGSSGGSAVAVTANMCLAALGSDTGGSIRQPASFCGITGLKPTYGRVSRSGLIAMASSFDQIGPLAKSAEDAALVLSVIQGQDNADQTTSDVEVFTPDWKDTVKGLKIGLPRQAWAVKGIEPDVREATEKSLKLLESLGAELVDIDLPYVDEALAVYYVLMPCEVSANLSRFDAMRFGARKQGLPLFETYSESRAENLGSEVQRRILIGTFALSSGYIDAYYVHAKKVQTLIRDGYKKAFESVDLIVTPTAPTTAFKLGEKLSDPLSMYLEDIFTVSANVAGLPALSIPCESDGQMPVGLHFLAPWFEEAKLLSTAKILQEKITE